MYHMKHTHTMNALLTVSVRVMYHMEHTVNALLTVSVRGMYHMEHTHNERFA